MKQIILSITLFSILAILPFASFGQTNANKCVSGNCVNGEGKMVYSNGNIYEGDFINGKADGQGTSNFADSATYTGQYSNDLFHGKGKYIYPNGSIYDGNWVKGKIEGRGKFVNSNGTTYEGDYVNGKANGQGIFKLKDGRIYAGQFSNDLINGKGKMTFADGGIYEGNWVNGNREGQGTYTAKDGSYASGEWKNNNLNGYGKDYSKATNITREGTYRDGFFIEAPAKVPTPQDLDPNVATQLQALSQYFNTFRDKFQSIEIIDGTLYLRLEEDNIESMKISDLADVKVVKKDKEQTIIGLMCKQNTVCSTLAGTNGDIYKRSKYITFNVLYTEKTDPDELFVLLKNLHRSLNGEIVTPASFAAKPPSSLDPTKAGNLSDCKIIISDGCRSFFLNSTIDQIGKQINLTNTYNPWSHFQMYRSKGIALSVEPTSGRVIEVEIDKGVIGWKPNNNLKWDEAMDKVRMKYKRGDFSYNSLYGERISYPNYTFGFKNGLHTIHFKQSMTESELAARNGRVKEAERVAQVAREREAQIEAAKRARRPAGLNDLIDDIKRIHAKGGDSFIGEGEVEQQSPSRNEESRGLKQNLSHYTSGYVFVAISKDLTMTNISKNGEILEFPRNNGDTYYTSQLFLESHGYKIAKYTVVFFGSHDSTLVFMPHGKNEGTAYWMLFAFKKDK